MIGKYSSLQTVMVYNEIYTVSFHLSLRIGMKIKTKQNEVKQNETKQNQNMAKRNKTKNKAKRNKIKQNKTKKKQIKAKTMQIAILYKKKKTIRQKRGTWRTR